MSTDYNPRHGADDLTPVEYQKPGSMMFSNATFDKLKWVAQIFLPALGTFVFTVGLLWGFPEDTVGKVVGTIVAIDTLLGLLLGLSTRAYENSGAKYDGQVNVMELMDGQRSLSLDLDVSPDDLSRQKEVTLKVQD